jgi:hypothetical protein
VAGRFQIIFQFINQRDPCRNVETRDHIVGYFVQLLHKRPQAVAVGGDQNSFS